MIRNIIAYTLPHGWPHTATDMAVLMQRRLFQPCGALDSVSHGFVLPREEAELCEPIAGRYYQLSIGRAPTLLGLTFDNRVSFILNNRLEMKRILLNDILTAGRDPADNAIKQFDADFTLYAEEVELALEALVDVMGGLVVTKRDDLVDQARNAVERIGNDLDPLYHDAKRIVIAERKPSISLVQRHLRIGYNRAARLIEQMEADGIVSATRADGTREVLAA